MVKIVCEMCNSNEFAKVDGMLVCQCCGTKYSVEEAKKLMIDGTVDVQGTVKVDNSSFVQKYLENARRAKAKEDWDEVEKYYNLVEQNDPTNIEAIFYSAFAKAKSSLVVNDIFKRQEVFRVLCNCVSILDDNFDVANCEESLKVMKGITDDVIDMHYSNFVFTETTKTSGYGYTSTSNDKDKTYQLFIHLSSVLFETLQGIEKKIPAGNKAALMEILHLQSMNIHPLTIYGRLDKESIIQNIKIGMGIEARIRAMDPSYTGGFHQSDIDFHERIAKSNAKSDFTGWCIAIIVFVVFFILFMKIFTGNI